MSQNNFETIVEQSFDLMKLITKIDEVLNEMIEFQNKVNYFYNDTPTILYNISFFIKNDLDKLILKLSEAHELLRKIEYQ